mmetsp:Transcript_76397/g.212218  ORF Transcript_76397/g.212218 Transcript_76397/m.212218 type:complete len:262 (+) Transcript_76397:286-1071(+)
MWRPGQGNRQTSASEFSPRNESKQMLQSSSPISCGQQRRSCHVVSNNEFSRNVSPGGAERDLIRGIGNQTPARHTSWVKDATSCCALKKQAIFEKRPYFNAAASAADKLVLVSARFGSAPPRSNAAHIARRRRFEGSQIAKCNGVKPCPVRKLASAPASNNAITTSKWPWQHATCKAEAVDSGNATWNRRVRFIRTLGDKPRANNLWMPRTALCPPRSANCNNSNAATSLWAEVRGTGSIGDAMAGARNGADRRGTRWLMA